MFTVLDNHHLYFIPKHFRPRNGKTIKQFSPISPLPSVPDNHYLNSISTDLPILNISYKWDPTICDFWCLTSSTWHNVFEAHHLVVRISTSFLLMANSIPLCVCVCVCVCVCAIFCPSIHPLMNIWASSTFQLREKCSYEHSCTCVCFSIWVYT